MAILKIRDKNGNVTSVPVVKSLVVKEYTDTKPEQEKKIDITENGTTEVIPDEGKTLSKVTVNVDVESGGGSQEDNPLKYATFSNGALFRGAIFPKNYILNIGITIDKIQGCNLQQKFMSIVNVDEINIVFKGNTDSLYMVNTFHSTSAKKIRMLGIVLKPLNVMNCFADSIYLEEIEAMFDLSLSTNVSNMFLQTTNLKEVRFVENTIPLSISFARSPFLSDETIQSIIDGLATVETSQTLTLHADVKAKLTEEQLTTITSKNWTLA